MAKTNKNKKQTREEKAQAIFYEGYYKVAAHPMFQPLELQVYARRGDGNPSGRWAQIDDWGHLYFYPWAEASPAEWTYVVAHCLLHLGMGHFKTEPAHPTAWNVACDLIVARFLDDLKLGKWPSGGILPDFGRGQTVESLYERFCRDGIPDHLHGFGTAEPGNNDMIWAARTEYRWYKKPDWEQRFGVGLRQAVTAAVQVAAGQLDSLAGARPPVNTPAQRAKKWFINSFPLLGALASAFDIIEDARICQRMQVSVGAVDVEQREIYMNPAAGLDEEECRFVMAHELLHVGLRHHARREGRDPYLWNVACDYVINGWLVEMGIGSMPRIGVLYDPEFKNESAESLYDRIVNDLRRFRKLRTLRGKGMCDIIDPSVDDWWRTRAGMELDEFYRRCLAQGLIYHEQYGRGLLPAGLIEEIRALSVPPIPWDVELAQWFDRFFPPIEKHRSYARPSRRQSATPDIPRPRYVVNPLDDPARTFGVVLDTSGSMDRHLLAKALGAIASYSAARDVPAARVVFCDAAPYDAGYMSPDDIASRVRVKGRGGTVLQPAINLLERADDFPKTGPILIITDGWIEDRLRIRREHAFLLPDGNSLPFRAAGPVFRIS